MTYTVEIIGPNGLRAPADEVYEDGDELVVSFHDVPEGFYTAMWVNEVPAQGFRVGFPGGSYYARVGWKPVVVEYRTQRKA